MVATQVSSFAFELKKTGIAVIRKFCTQPFKPDDMRIESPAANPIRSPPGFGKYAFLKRRQQRAGKHYRTAKPSAFFEIIFTLQIFHILHHQH